MRYVSVDYTKNDLMKWLQPRLQLLLYVASITSHEATKELIYKKIGKSYEK